MKNIYAQMMVLWLTALFVLLAGPATAWEEPSDAVVRLYLTKIKPLLQERCWACHGALKQESGLRLDAVELIQHGSDSGPVVLTQQSDASELLLRVRSADPGLRMPPMGEPLAAEQIAAIENWIENGALGPSDEQPEEDPQQHWAFKRPQRPRSLDVDSEGAAHPIDVLVDAQLENANLEAQPRADPHIRLRRLYLDLIGVPPTVAQLQAFLRDPSDRAWSETVDRLLGDARYGERWGRHWMDVWRYSDWYGRRHVPDVWNSAPQIWRWRDWIVQSLNNDCGYDALVHQMLAGDELEPASDGAGYATGYLIRNWYALNPNDWMRANVEHTAKAFLGLTFNCAHCHDHKYDPISQDDYFRLRAFFEPIYVRQQQVPGEPDPGPFQDYEYSGPLRRVVRLGSVRIFDKTPEAPTWFYSGGDERNRESERGAYAPGVPDFLSAAYRPPTPVDLPLEAWYPGLRPEIVQTLVDDQQAQITALELKRKSLAAPDPAHQSQLQAVVTQTEEQVQQALKARQGSGESAVISGRQSLLLDASQGRRILAHELPHVPSLPEGAVIQFRLRLLTDTHFNFQLAKDVSQGLTASYISLEAGRIVAYRPASFAEIEVGQYQFAAGERQFHIQLTLDRAADRCLLTITCENNDAVLVEQVPVALNAWDPAVHAANGIFLDARPGSVVLLDDWSITSPTTATDQPLWSIDFEPPAYRAELDVLQQPGWKGSPLGKAPAVSRVTMDGGDPGLRELSMKLQTARRALEAYLCRDSALDTGIVAARATQASIRARERAERSKYAAPGSLSTDEIAQAALQAVQAERVAKRLQAQAETWTRLIELAELETSSAEDKERAKKIESASQQLQAAEQRLAAELAATEEEAAGIYSDFGPTYPRSSTGRRLALAKWITHPDNPLTARVAVNHLWARHFHKPLVESVANFGRSGAKPTHPELLDWLAVELMEHNWSLKHIHRLILTSQTWQRSSAVGSNTRASSLDPQNRLLWRMNTGRMEAEVVRDSLLYCANYLDTQQGGQELENAQALTTYRRSLYYSCNPENDGKSEFGKLFDAPEPGDCYRRSQTIVPQQALALTNSPLVHELSLRVAQQVLDEPTVGPSWEERLGYLFQRFLSRPPTNPELLLCRQTFEDTRSDGALPALALLVRVLINHNDFITIR